LKSITCIGGKNVFHPRLAGLYQAKLTAFQGIDIKHRHQEQSIVSFSFRSFDDLKNIDDRMLQEHVFSTNP
jgi:hypothetical protein